MNLVKCFGKVLIISGLIVSSSYSSATSEIVSGVVSGLFSSSSSSSSNSNQSRSTQPKKTSSTKRRSTIPSNCSSERWITQSINNKPSATNFQGLIVSYDDMGDLIVKASIKNPIPSMFKNGDKVQLTAKFSKGNRITSATLDEKNKILIISGIDAMYITEKLKASSYIKIDFVNNKYCTRLKGSSNAIRTVASSATFWKNNRPDHIKEARVTRAAQEHATRSMRVASNQKEFGEKMVGIRPKSDLDAADGNVNATKIQWYVPGSEEIGEMFAEWYIDDDKGPMMKMTFIDPRHKYRNEQHVIKISLNPITGKCNKDLNVKPDENTSPSCKLVKDLLRTDKWGKKAKKKGIKRQITKKVSYITGNKESRISLSVNFKIYEDGGMAAQIEEKKHGYPNRFNFTLANALELANYIENTRVKAHTKWMNKTMSAEDIDALFN